MFTFALIIFIGACISVVAAFFAEDIIGSIRNLLIGVGLTLFVAFVGTFILSIVLLDSAKIVDMGIREVRYPIKSIEDNHDNNGSFVLGCGGFTSTPSYYFYYELPTGGYKMGSINSEYATIYEGIIPMLIRRYKQTKLSESNWVWYRGRVRETEIEAHLYVPKNTIKVNYNLDTK